MKKKKSSNLPYIFIFLLGFSLLAYPIVSNYVNSFSQSKAVSNYEQEVLNIKTEDYSEYFEKANAFNASLKYSNWLRLSKSEKETYYQTLDIVGNGMMGYIEIDKIGVKLPIYHGTSDNVLQTAIGHLEGSSLPVGGAGTHCLLSGHRGLPSAILFSDLDQLEVGDKFMIHILNQTFTYQIYEINIVLPEDSSSLELEKGLDLCTLITCTPYGINSHRLLVHASRVENDAKEEIVNVSANALSVDIIYVAPFMAVPFLFLFILWVVISDTLKRIEKKIREKMERKMLYDQENRQTVHFNDDDD